MDSVEKRWERRAIASQNANETAILAASDGHNLQADTHGRGPQFAEPLRLIVTCLPIEHDDDADASERWPTFDEIFTAGDLLAPGTVFAITFLANPRTVERVPLPVGTPRAIELSQVGVVSVPGEILTGVPS